MSTRSSVAFLMLSGALVFCSIGCNPQMLTLALLPFDDGKQQPEYKLFAEKKEITIAIATSFARAQTDPDLQGADSELADDLETSFRLRCGENKHKIKFIPHAEVRSQQLKQSFSRDGNPVALGKSLKADYVLDVTINSLKLYDKIYGAKMFRGRGDLTINLYKMDVKDGSHRVFSKEYTRVHPREDRPSIDAGASSAAAYRNLYVGKIASEVSRMFIAFDEREKKTMLE